MDRPLTAERPHGVRWRTWRAAVFLELLARATPPAIEYERPLVRGPGRPVRTPGELAELERAKRLALQVRAALERAPAA